MMFSNCFDVVQPAERAERDLGLLVRCRSADAPIVPVATCVFCSRMALHHVAGRQVARGQLGRIDPDAHAVIALAEQEDVADAVDAGQLVLDLHQGVVAQVELVVAAVVASERDAHRECRATASSPSRRSA